MAAAVSRHPQRTRVIARFEETADYWRDVYSEPGVQGLIYRERQAAVLDMVDRACSGSRARIVELGCGAGRLTVELARRGHRVHAVDISPAMVEQARAHVAAAGLDRDVQVTLDDVQALAIDSASADLVVAVGVIPWLEDASAALREIARLLVPGGHVVLTADNRARLETFTDPRANPVLTPVKLLRRRLRGDTREPGYRQHWPRQVRRLLAGAGFSEVESRTVGFGPFTIWGRTVIGDRRGIVLHERLQSLADRGVPIVRWAGWHHLVSARRAERPSLSPAEPAGPAPAALGALPVIHARDVEALAAFYARLGFEEWFRMPGRDGLVGYIALRCGTAELAVTAEDSPRMLAGFAPGPGSRHELFVYVEDVDATIAALQRAGVSVVREPADMPWGERVGFVTDPEGNLVSLAAPRSSPK
jgi:lactoylglutathione lyase